MGIIEEKPQDLESSIHFYVFVSGSQISPEKLIASRSASPCAPFLLLQ
jgi:hypothetical protein